jgi:proline dehydrogenase
MALLREPLLLLSRSEQLKRLVSTMPVSAGIVSSYVPGETTASVVEATDRLVADGLEASLDHLGEDTLDVEQADATVAAYRDVLAALSERGLARHAEVSVKLSAIGQALEDNGHKVALENARAICRAARNAGTTVTLDMEDHTTTDSTLAILHDLRKDFPETGAVLQAYLHRTEADCRALAYEGSRVRLCKGAYNEPEHVAYQERLEVDKSYVRCLKVLMAGHGYPRPPDDRDRLHPCQSPRPHPGHLRVPDAVRDPAGGAAAAARQWRDGARLRALRCGVVRLPDAPARGAAAEPVVLLEVPRLEEVSPP